LRTVSDIDFDKALGATLRIQREKRRLRQGEVATFLGVTFQQYQKYESGLNRLPIIRLLDLCRFLGVLPEEILSDAIERSGWAAHSKRLLGGCDPWRDQSDQPT